MEIMHDAVDEVEQWLQENVAPVGYYFEWRDGEFFLSAGFAALAAAADLRGLVFKGERLNRAGTYADWTWEALPNPIGGESASMSDMKDATAGETPTHFEVPVTIWGDYCGDICGRSNYRRLLEDFPDTFVEVLGDYSSQYLAIPADWTPEDDGEEDMVNLFTGLRLYDDEDESKLVDELAWEAWDQYLRFDIVRELDRFGVDTDAIDEDELKERFYALVSEANESPRAESATDVIFPYFDDHIAELAAHYGIAETEDDQS